MNKVAILLSTFNGERYIRELLDSLVAQSHKELDVIVRDDGSSDRTEEIIIGFSAKLRITMLPKGPNVGPAQSFMALLDAAGPDYDVYMYSDQDDYWNSDKVARCVSHLSQAECAGVPALYFTRLELVDECLGHLTFSRAPRWLSPKYALVENLVTGCSMGINGAARRRLLKARPENLAMHDWWIYLVVSFFGRVYFDNVASIKYRQHGANVVGAATNVVDSYARKLKRFFFIKHRSPVPLSRQARQFLDIYGEDLSLADQEMIRLICEDEKSFRRSLYLFLFSPFRRQTPLDNLFLRLVFLFGRY